MNMFRELGLLAAGFVFSVSAQDVSMALPVEDLIAKQDQVLLDRQGAEIFKALDMLASPYRQSVVAVVDGERLMSSGIVAAPGIVISKYSDLTRTRRPLVVVDADNKIYDLRVLGASIESDVIFLEVPGLKAKPVDLSDPAQVSEGSMVFIYSPEGKVTDHGVISVEQRSLREQDQAYIGLLMDPFWQGGGAFVNGVDKESPAYVIGLRPGDVIRKVNGQEIDGVLSLRTILNQVNPGDKVSIAFLRKDKEMLQELVAGRRYRERSFPQKRLEQMNSMGNRMSRRRSDFPVVYQSDMTLLPERAGSPVIDLDGKLVGIALSRAGRVETFILPTWVIRDLTAKMLSESSPEEDSTAD